MHSPSSVLHQFICTSSHSGQELFLKPDCFHFWPDIFSCDISPFFLLFSCRLHFSLSFSLIYKLARTCGGFSPMFLNPPAKKCKTRTPKKETHCMTWKSGEMFRDSWKVNKGGGKRQRLVYDCSKQITLCSSCKSFSSTKTGNALPDGTIWAEWVTDEEAKTGTVPNTDYSLHNYYQSGNKDLLSRQGNKDLNLILKTLFFFCSLWMGD